MHPMDNCIDYTKYGVMCAINAIPPSPYRITATKIWKHTTT